MSKLAKTFIGTGIIVGIGLLDLEGIGVLLLLSVVCTFGLGAIPLLFIGYVVGSVAVAIFSSAKNSNGKINSAVSPAANPNEKVEHTVLSGPVSQYVDQAREIGLSDSVIRERLKIKGWGEEAIESALKQ